MVAGLSYGQVDLQRKIEQISDSISGKLGVSIRHIESEESISFNGDQKFPMQSVYKFPIAMVMLHETDAGNFSLKEKIQIDTIEYIPKAGHSPLRDRYPNGASLTIKEILEYNVSKSDGTACDVLLRLMGGTESVQQKLDDLGVKGMAIATSEMIQVAHDTIQYQNWTTPDAMSELLSAFINREYLSEGSTALLTEFMSVSNKWFDKRIKGLLPKGTELIHKTGTSRTHDGLTRATNDAGIITLPDNSHLAVSIFLTDSYDTRKKRELTIARVARIAFDHWTNQKQGTK